MLAKVTSRAGVGLDVQLVDVEVDIGSGQVMFTIDAFETISDIAI